METIKKIIFVTASGVWKFLKWVFAGIGFGFGFEAGRDLYRWVKKLAVYAIFGGGLSAVLHHYASFANLHH